MSEYRVNRGGGGGGGGGRGPRREPRGGSRPRGAGGDRGAKGGAGGGKLAAVTARFADVSAVRRFFVRLGMPDSLVKQLGGWLEDLAPGGEAERMEPELTWEGREIVLGVTALVDEEDGGVDVEFAGPASLIEALQVDLDEFFRPKQDPKGKK